MKQEDADLSDMTSASVGGIGGIEGAKSMSNALDLKHITSSLHQSYLDALSPSAATYAGYQNAFRPHAYPAFYPTIAGMDGAAAAYYATTPSVTAAVSGAAISSSYAPAAAAAAAAADQWKFSMNG